MVIVFVQNNSYYNDKEWTYFLTGTWLNWLLFVHCQSPTKKCLNSFLLKIKWNIFRRCVAVIHTMMVIVAVCEMHHPYWTELKVFWLDLFIGKCFDWGCCRRSSYWCWYPKLEASGWSDCSCLCFISCYWWYQISLVVFKRYYQPWRSPL